MKFTKIVALGIPEYYLDNEYWNKIKSLGEKFVSLQKDSSDLKKELSDADCVLLNPFSLNLDRELINSIPKLRFVDVLATAYGKVDLDYAASKNVVVSNIPGYSTESVSEFVFAAILEHIRQLEKGKIQARSGNYSEAGFSATEIKGKNFGVLGLGRIGSRVAEIALGFGANVKYWSRNRKPDLELKGIDFENLDVLMRESDILSVHLALTPETKNFLDKTRVKMLKKDAVLINTAPMELIDIDAVEDRLKSENLSFILDHSDEMKESDLKRLLKCKNCVIYPPIAYLSKEGRINKQNIFFDNLENFLRGTPTNKVN